MGQLIALNSKCKRIFYVGFFYLFLNNFCYSQETHPARVLTGPTFASELFELQIPQIKELVPNLVNIELGFDLANWYWSCNPSVAAATMSIHVDIGEVKYVGFVMKLPNGGEKRVSFEEIGIQANRNPSICDIRLDIDFSKFNIHASTEIDVYNGKGQGSIRFNNELPQEFHDYLKFDHEKKRYKTVQEIFSGLDPKVSIVHRGSYNCNIMNFESNFYLNQIKKYIDNEYKENDLNNKIKTLLTEAQNAESSGRIDEAIMKYEEAYKLKKVPEIKLKIDDLKTKKTSLESTENNPNVNNPTSINDNGTNNSFNSNSANPEDLRKFNEMQQNVNDWNQNWYNNIQREEMLRKQKQEMYDREVQKFANNLVDIINKIEQEKQQEEIAKKQKRINRAVSDAFSSVKAESDYWSGFASDLLNVVNKYSKNLDKTAYDEIESSLNAIKRTLDEIGKEHNSLQEKLRKDWDYADNDPRRFRVSYWEDYSFRKEAYIDFYQTFTVGSRISDKTIRCNFVNDLLPLINKHAERRQSTYHITSIEQAYIASGCKNYNYENLLKSAKAIEAYEKMRNEKTKQIQALKKKVEEELVEIKVLESTGVKVENISNQYQIEGVDLSDLKNEYNLLKGNSGAFENELKKLNPDNLIKAYGGANTGSLVFKPSGIYVAPGTFEVTFSREFSSPKEHKVTLNAQKGQKTLTINPKDYNSAFEFDARFKPYRVTFANKYEKKNGFGKTYWLVPEFKYYTSGITEFNLTPIGLIESYSPKGFYKGRPVFIHRLNFFALSVGKINLINGFVTSDNSSQYKLHSDYTYFGIDIMRYEAGFTQPLFNGKSELRLFAGATYPIRYFLINQKEEFSVSTTSSDFAEDSYKRWFGNLTIYPRVEFVTHLGKTMIEFGYTHNFILLFDDLQNHKENEKLKSQIGQEELYQKYLPFNNFKNLLKHEFSIRFTF